MEIFIACIASFWFGTCCVAYLVFKLGYKANPENYSNSISDALYASHVKLSKAEGQEILDNLVSNANKMCERGLFGTMFSMPITFFIKLPKYTLPTLMSA